MKFASYLKTNKVLTILFQRKALGYSTCGVLGLVLISFLTSIWMSPLSALRMVFGLFYVLILPGLVLTFAFFPLKPKGEKGSIDTLERMALSFALSLAVVPLVVFYLNLIRVKINFFNVFWEILLIILIGAGVIWWRRKKKG